MFQWWGLKKYQDVAEMQLTAWQNLTQDPQGFVVLGGEHPSVITLGVRGRDTDVLGYANPDLKIPIVKTDRGGQATLHSPGQLVVYPIIPLSMFNLKVTDLVCLLESSCRKTLQSLDVPLLAQPEPGQSGVFTPKGKIMSLGLRIQRDVSRHGMAVNISNDLSLFSGISACGQAQRAMDSLENWQPGISPKNFFELWSEVFLEDLTSRQPYSTVCSNAGSVGAVGSAFP